MQVLYSEVDARFQHRRYSLVYYGKDLFSFRKSTIQDIFSVGQNDVTIIEGEYYSMLSAFACSCKYHKFIAVISAVVSSPLCATCIVEKSNPETVSTNTASASLQPSSNVSQPTNLHSQNAGKLY